MQNVEKMLTIMNICIDTACKDAHFLVFGKVVVGKIIIWDFTLSNIVFVFTLHKVLFVLEAKKEKVGKRSIRTNK